MKLKLSKAGHVTLQALFGRTKQLAPASHFEYGF